MSKQEKYPFINFNFDNAYIGFIKAIASRNVDDCWKFAYQLRQYDTKADEAIEVLEDWININREKQKVDGELYELKIKAKNLQEQNTRLTYQKSPALNKKQWQTASIAQFLRTHVNSVIMVESEPDTLEELEKVQENNLQGQQLVRVQYYIQKIELLELINNNLTEEKKQCVEQIVRIKNKLENTERALEQLKQNDKRYLEEQKKKLNTEINKLKTKSKATESPPNLLDILASQIQMQKNILKQKIIEELHKQIETMKQQHKEETKELQNTIDQLTREVFDQKLKLERIELYNKNLINQKKQQKGKLMQLQKEVIKISNERNYLLQELYELHQNKYVQDQQIINLMRVLKKIHSLGVKSSLESEKQ